MPRLIPTSASETPALLALRRTLWQLAILGLAAAVTITRIAPHSGLLAAWCALIPLTALMTHYRHTFAALLFAHRTVQSERGPLRRVQRSQARRTRGDVATSRLRRQPRVQMPRDPAQAGPRAS